MLADEVAAHLASGGLGLTEGTNLFKRPFPEGAPDRAVSITEYGGREDEQNMSASLTAPLFERPRFQVMVRDVQSTGYHAGRTLANNVKNQLDGLFEADLSSVRYHRIQALSNVLYLGEDGNARHQWAINCEAWKKRSTS